MAVGARVVRRRGPVRSSRRFALGAVLFALALGAACADPAPLPPPPEVDPTDLTFAPQLAVDLAAMNRTPGGVYVQDLFMGGGVPARQGREVVLAYTGWLHDGTKVLSTEEVGPLVRRLGGSDLIQGWQEGLEGMREGGRRKIVIPAHLGYGVQGLPPWIPPQAVLVISVELLDVR